MSQSSSAEQVHSCVGHYLTPDQLEYFHQILCDWRQRLKAEYAESRLRIRTQEETGGDIIDRSTKDSARSLEMIQRNRKHRLITQIDAALQRIAEGSYGYCKITGEEIGFERLRAYPVAILSVTTQEKMEQHYHWKN